MRRRTFLRGGLLALGAPALLPAGGRGHAFLTPRQERPPGGPIRLSTNENPLGIPESAREAMIRGFPEANRYPGASRRALREVLAARHGVPAGAVVLGNGAAEVLQMAVHARLDPRLRLVVAEPTYEDVIEYCAPLPWVELRPVPLDGSYAHDLEGMEEACRGAPGPVLVYVCNPNNPTGTLTPVEGVVDWVRRAPESVHFLVDEAYFDFVASPGYRSLDRLALENPNVVVVRTFSKIYGMAGIRLGYALARPETARRLHAFAAGTNVNHLALVAGLAAMEDSAWVRLSLETNGRSRGIAYRVLEELGLPYIPSHTNFVMHRIPGDLRRYIDRMAGEGIRVGRPFPPMLDHSRCSLGLPEEMERWAQTLRSFRRKGWV